MNALGPQFEASFTSRLCLTLLHSLWQIGLLAIALWVSERFASARSVEARYKVHVVALLLAIAAVPLTFLLLDGSQESTVRSVSMVPVATTVAAEPKVNIGLETSHARSANSQVLRQQGVEHSPVTASQENTFAAAAFSVSITRWIVAVYALGVLLMLGRLLRGMWLAQRMVSRARFLTDGPLVAATCRLAERWKLTTLPRLAISDALAMPCVTGLLRPTIVFPLAALSGMSPAELELILVHELAHVRRHDLWIHLLQRVAEAALFFNPGLWFLSRRLSILREYCCDELACGVPASASESTRLLYAAALVHSAELQFARTGRFSASSRAEIGALAAAGSSPSDLRRRVARILDEPLREPLLFSRGNLLTLVVSAGMLFVLPVLGFTGPPSPEKLGGQSTKAATTEPPVASTPELPFPMEIVAIGATEEGKPTQWWDAEGNLLEKAPYVPPRKARKESPFKETTPRELVFKLPGLPKGMSVRYELDTGVWQSHREARQPDLMPLPDGQGSLFHEEFFMPAKIKTFSFRMGIATGNWTTDYTGGTVPTAQGNQRKSVALSGVLERDGIPTVVVSHWGDRESRVLAIDKSGKPHEPSSFTELKADVVNQAIYEYKGLAASDIEKFEFQVPEFKWRAVDLPAYPKTEKTDAQSAKATFSGRIVARDGSPVKTKGYLAVDGSGGISLKAFSTENQPDNRFTLSANPGSVWVKYFPEEAAPIVLGPLEAQPGQAVNDLELLLEPGYSATLRVHDTQDRPISGATVIWTPRNGISYSGTATQSMTSADGQLLLQHLADMPYEIRVQADGYRTLRLESQAIKPGEVLSVKLEKNSLGSSGVVTVKGDNETPTSRSKAEIRGEILDGNGLPMTTAGQLEYEFTDSTGSVTKATADSQPDRYSISLPPGVVWLKYFAAGHAPAWVGPLTLNAGQVLDDVDLKLTKGHSATLHFVNQQGRPIPLASVIAHPVVGLGAGGPNLPQTADATGRLQLKHLADAPYNLRIEAPGYQPLSVNARRIGPGEVLTLTLQQSRPASGRLLTADGHPAAGATLRMRVAALPDNHYDSQDEVVATADAKGRFSIGQLRDDAWYLVLAEAVDGAKVFLPPVRAGQEDIEVTLPPRRDLRLKLVGDLSLLQMRGGKPFVRMQQQYEFHPAERVNYGDLIGAEGFVTPTADGGVVEFKGLIAGDVKIVAGTLQETYRQVVGEAEVTLLLPAVK